MPGEQIDASEAAETVTYRLADGSAWTDGADLYLPEPKLEEDAARSYAFDMLAERIAA